LIVRFIRSTCPLVVIGLALFMIADISGAVPTLRDTWHDPRTETPEPWLLGLAGSAVNLTLVDPSAWTAGLGGFAIWGFPVYLAALNAGILALIARRHLLEPRYITQVTVNC
jgi:fatty acid desaturase